MPRDVSRGVNSVKRFVRQANMRGVHGTLIELIDVIPQLHTAVEARPCLSRFFSQPALCHYARLQYSMPSYLCCRSILALPHGKKLVQGSK